MDTPNSSLRYVLDLPDDLLLNVVDRLPIVHKFQLLLSRKHAAKVMKANKSIWQSTRPLGTPINEEQFRRHIFSILRSMQILNDQTFAFLQIPSGVVAYDILRCFNELAGCTIYGFGYPRLENYASMDALATINYLRSVRLVKVHGNLFTSGTGSRFLRRMSTECKGLRGLQVHKVCVDLEFAKKIKEFFPDLESLEMSGCILTGMGIQQLIELPNLNTLDISKAGSRGMTTKIMEQGNRLRNFRHDKLVKDCCKCKEDPHSIWYQESCSHTPMVPNLLDISERDLFA